MRNQYTIGVEEEYQLVDAETGALRSRASDVLSTDWSEELRSELHDTTVEINTSICTGYDDVEAELKRRRFQAAVTAAAENLEIAAAGLHPFSDWEGHGISDTPRYRAIAERHDRVAREVNIFGMHVHVGVPEHIDRTALMEQMRAFIPHLLALSASSPFLGGEDTGFASYRAILWRQYPYTGIPPRFENEQEYERFMALLLRSDAIKDRGNVYWSLRPHFSYPTLEFRATDTCPRLEDAATIASFARLIVVGVAEGRIEAPGGGGLSHDTWRVVLTENEWHAARYGLDATLTDPESPDAKVSTRTALRRLMDSLGRLAAELDEAPVLERLEALLERGNGADRLRRVYAEYGSFERLVGWLVDETRLSTGFDRRRTQRISADAE